MRLLRNVWFVAVIALTLRVAVIFALGESGRMMGDSTDYLAAAQALADGEPYPESVSLPFWRAPGYPAAIAIVWRVVPGSIMAIIVVQALLHVLGLTLLGGILQKTFGGTTAFLGRWWYALYPPFMIHAATIQTETWFQVGILALTWALLATAGRRRHIAGAALILALTTLVRPVGLLLMPLVLLWLAFWGRGRGVRAVIVDTALVVTVFFATLLPWAAQNQARTGEWVLVTNAGWFNLWYTTTPEARAAVWDPKHAQPGLDSLLTIRIPAMKEGWPPRPMAQRTAFWKDQALVAMAGNPAEFVTYRLYGIWSTWRPWVTRGFYSTRAVLASATLFLPWLLLGWLGLVRAWRTRPDSWPFLSLVLAYAMVATATNLLGTPVLRYRIPLVDPYFIGLASAWLAVMCRQDPLGRWLTDSCPPPDDGDIS